VVGVISQGRGILFLGKRANYGSNGVRCVFTTHLSNSQIAVRMGISRSSLYLPLAVARDQAASTALRLVTAGRVGRRKHRRHRLPHWACGLPYGGGSDQGRALASGSAGSTESHGHGANLGNPVTGAEPVTRKTGGMKIFRKGFGIRGLGDSAGDCI
jgi:hypothetical protein